MINTLDPKKERVRKFFLHSLSCHKKRRKVPHNASISKEIGIKNSSTP
jgi:hypothetical protein